MAQLAHMLICLLQDKLFPTPVFHAWLAAISGLLPLRHAVEAHRFCPGLGYALVTSEKKEARLDVVLELMPEVNNDNKVHVTKGKGKVKL
jgi:hypothetical protein